MELTMRLSDFIPLLSVVVAVAAWFVDRIKQRAQERFRKLLDYRMGMLNDIISINEMISKDPEKLPDNFVDHIAVIRSKVMLYGSVSEIELVEEFVKGLREAVLTKEQRYFDKANIAWLKLAQTATNAMRCDLGLERITVTVPQIGRRR